MTTIEKNQELEDEIDIIAYIKLLLSKWYWIALSCFICGILALVTYRYSTKEYQVSSSIIIVEKEDALGSMTSLLKDFGGTMKGTANIDNQIGVLQSYTLIRNTLEKLNFQISYYVNGRVRDVEIYDDCPFYVDLDTSYNDYNDIDTYTPEKIDVDILSDNEYLLSIHNDSSNIKEKLVWGEEYKDSVYRFTIRKCENFDIAKIQKNKSSFRFVINNYSLLTKQYQKNLVVEANSRKGTIVNLSITDLVPEKATIFMNGLIDMCIEQDLEDKNQTSKRSEQFINDQLTQITDSLVFVESNLEEFRSNNKIVNLSDEGSLLYKKAEEQETLKSQIDIRLKYYNYLLKSLKSGNGLDNIKMMSITGIEDPLLTSLISQLNKLYTDKQVLTYSATPDNPNLQIINMKIGQTLSALIDNVNSLIESTKLELNEVSKEIEKMNGQIRQLPSTERELISIQRQFDVNNAVYNFLLQKRAEIGLTKAANISDIKIVDPARRENAEQSFPKLKLLLALALFLGICIPCCIIIVINLLDRTIKGLSSLETTTSLPIIGTVIHNRYSETIPVKSKPKSSIAESFRGIRSNLPFFLKNRFNTNTIAITSTISGEGKSFCALNTAAILSMLNKKTLIIGLDLRKPRLAEMLNISNNIGVTTHLIGRDSLDDVIMPTGIPNLDVIVAGPVPPNPAELVESQAFTDFLNNCKQKKYDYIILDTPPIGLVTDTLSISHFADCNIFVMRQNYTNVESITLVNSLAKEKQMKNLCVLLNDVTNTRTGYNGYTNYNKNNNGYYTEEEDHEDHKKTILKRIFRKRHNG